MWKKIVRNLRSFADAVVTGVDSSGYPFSVRCAPRLDDDLQVLRLDLPDSLNIKSGPAGMLCHSHDEKLWHLKSFLVQGKLEEKGSEWIFIPSRFIPGEGLGGQLSLLKILFEARSRTQRYLQKRGLPRPKIPWNDINGLRKESKNHSSQEPSLNTDRSSL